MIRILVFIVHFPPNPELQEKVNRCIERELKLAIEWKGFERDVQAAVAQVVETTKVFGSAETEKFEKIADESRRNRKADGLAGTIGRASRLDAKNSAPVAPQP